MKNIYAFPAFMACLLVTLGVAKADAFHTVSSGSYSWEDPAAWVGGLMPGDDIQNHDTVHINTEVVLMTHLGLKPQATLIIGDTMVIYNPTGNAVLECKGLIRVDGVLRIVAGQNGVANTLILKTGNANLEINGLLENVGSEMTNNGTILVQSDGVLRNYGYRDATDDNLVRSKGGIVYDLAGFASDLYGYDASGGSSIGHTGGTAPTGPSDTTVHGQVSWTCYSGFLDNQGDVIQRGGSVDYSQCGGGIVDGDGLDPGCQAPSNLRVSGSNASGLGFAWDPVQAAQRYMIGLKPAGSSRYRIVRSVNNGTSYQFPPDFFPTGVQADWAVLSICEAGNIDMNYLATATATLNRQAAVASFMDQAFRAFPNPAQDRVNIEASSPVEAGLVELYDVKGRRVLEQAFQLAQSGERLILSTEGLSDGLYVLKILGGSAVYQETVWVTR